MSSEALHLALALYRAPSKLRMLRGMQLPQDVGTVIQLASAPQPLLYNTAAEVGETEEIVVEASRFYLQQALFRPDADAYTLLGLDANASQAQIREHYRWLQRWLHPDRRGEDWEASFATRVNWAWNRLRNASARDAYDAAPRSQPGADEHMATTSPAALDNWQYRPSARVSSWGKWMAIGVSLCCAAAVGYVALMRDEGIAIESDPKPALRGETADAQAMPVRPPGLAAPDATATPPNPVSATLPASDAQAIAQPVAEPSSIPSAQQAAIAAAKPDASDPPPVPDAKEPISAGKDTRVIENPVASVAKAAMVPIPAPSVSPSNEARAITSETGTDSRTEASRPGLERIATSDSRKTLAQPSMSVARQGEASAGTNGKNAADARTEAYASDQRLPDHAAADARVDGALSPAAPAESSARMGLARQRVGELSSFFRSVDEGVPPVWNDVAGQTSAESQRKAMHDRIGLRKVDAFAVDTPVWQVSGDSATLQAAYHVVGSRAIAENGRLSVNMTWRERMWLITRVRLDPAL